MPSALRSGWRGERFVAEGLFESVPVIVVFASCSDLYRLAGHGKAAQRSL
jgi:hypothetical protein